MKIKDEIIDYIVEDGVLPLFYHDDVMVCIQTMAALYRAGIRNIEFTNRGKNARVNFKALIDERDKSMPELLLGTGTIKNTDDAKVFIEAGADFLVSPFFDDRISFIAFQENILYIPGCATPREIHLAEDAGLTLVKLFPGNTLGPSFVKAVKPLFPEMSFMVTGGVENNDANLKSWFDAGIRVVGLGSNLISESLLSKSSFDIIENNTRELLQKVKLLLS